MIILLKELFKFSIIQNKNRQINTKNKHIVNEPPKSNPNMSNYKLTHLKELESESIFILREVAAQFEKPALLFSGGKDSIVMAYLAYKAFYPAVLPFPFVHIDTGHNFEETLTYRDELVKKLGVNLIVGSVQESIDKGRVVEEKGYNASRNVLQTSTLLDTLEKNKFDAALGGARRDEEKARAKERFLSLIHISEPTRRTPISYAVFCL